MVPVKLIGLVVLGFVFVPDSSAAAPWRASFPYSHHFIVPTAPRCAKTMLWHKLLAVITREVHVHSES